MVRKLPAKDVVIVGLGWTGSILAYELAKAGLDVVVIERGPWRDTAAAFAPATSRMNCAIRLDLFLRPEQDTLTFRNNMSRTALPSAIFPRQWRRQRRAPAMPAFGWRIDESQAAAVLTYIRNSWGNAAPPVAASTIAKQRASLVAAP